MTKPAGKAPPHPFAALMGMAQLRLPKSPRATLVLEGRVVHSARDIPAENGLWHPDDQALARSEQKRLRSALNTVREAAKYQRKRQAQQEQADADGQATPARPNWNARHPEERRAYMAAYRVDPANRERINASCNAWQKRAYAQDPEKYRQRARDYYQRKQEQIRVKARERNARYYAEHRDEINARARQRRAADKAAAAAAATTPTNPTTPTERTDP